MISRTIALAMTLLTMPVLLSYTNPYAMRRALPPSGAFVGVANAGSMVVGTWSDGTAKIKLQFIVAPTAGSVDEFWIYYSNSSSLASFDLARPPWQIVSNTGANSFNPDATTPSFIFVGGNGVTFSGVGYFIVRAMRYGGNLESNQAISNAITIPSNQSNYVYVAPALSGLSYPYWIGAFESSLASGSYGADAIATTETNLTSCSYQFHTQHNAADASCGTMVSTAKAQSVAGQTPTTANWHQAWVACRNATTLGAVGNTQGNIAGNIYMRLPTEAEWRRASRWPVQSYATMWNTYSDGLAGNCNTISGALTTTGSKTNCIAAVGAYDMVGNTREWVDQRLTAYSISGASESRFSYGPTIGRIIANGLEVQASGVNTPVTRRYHNITPGANNLALLLGSDYQLAAGSTITADTTSASVTLTTASTSGLEVGQTVRGPGIPFGAVITSITPNTSFDISSAATATAAAVSVYNLYQKQYDPETEAWRDPTTAPTFAGFRCVAFPSSKLMPSMAQLAQAGEPTYVAASDIPGDPNPTAAQALSWVIPDNFYTKDIRPETLALNLSFFPNATNLAVWPFNNAADAATLSDVSGNAKSLTRTGALTTAQGLDGQTVANTFNGTTTYLSSSDALFDQTGAFTMGGWFYRSSWAAVAATSTLLSRTTAGLDGYSLELRSDGNLWFTSPGVADILSYAYTGQLAGWHHIVLVRGSATDHRIYIDGAQVASTSTNYDLASSGAFEVASAGGGANLFAGAMGNIFFHGGIGYTTQQVQRAHFAGIVSGAYVASSNVANADGVTITWKPWSKTVCNPSCSTVVDTGLTYNIYRYIEPSQLDIRPTVPWAIKTASGSYASLPANVSGANATGMPLDPLATDSSGSPLCTSSFVTTPMCLLVATISGSSCNSSTPAGCTFADNTTLSNGFSSTAIYNYIMVVQDAEGNALAPRVQRYRAPYFAGSPSLNAATTFRTEQRLRRASLALVDEAYQQVQAVPQIMVHVPMHVSGLDHDFFIGKYEGSTASGAYSGARVYPRQGTCGASGTTWLPYAGQCYDHFLRNASFTGAVTTCGNGTIVNATTAVVQSKQGTTPITSSLQEDFWKACRNTSISDGAGNSYYGILPSDAEWNKAADWGDVAQKGNVRKSAFGLAIGLAITTLEGGDNSTGYCDGKTTGPAISAAAGTRLCRSRHGAADMSGSYFEWSTGIFCVGTSMDNGTDGLTQNQSITTGQKKSTYSHYDLLRGLMSSSNYATISGNSDTFGTVSDNTQYTTLLRGGYYDNGTSCGGACCYGQCNIGRWSIVTSTAAAYNPTGGGRCVF